jgi:hypothetical protein
MIRNRQFRQSSILFLPALAFTFMAGCKKPSINFGNSFSQDNTTNVVVTDTFGVSLSTVFVDSFPTAASGSMLVGTYRDEVFGTVASKSFLQLMPPSSLPTISNLAGYDSLRLYLLLNKSFYGDTSKVQRYMAAQLQSMIRLPDNQVTFYNKWSVPFDPASPLGYSDVQINPTNAITSQRVSDTVKIKLPDSQGRELFRMLYNQSDTIKTANNFLYYFKGLCIYPDPSLPGAIYGFKDSIVMRLYYHEPGLTLQNKTADFILNNKAYQFNQITADKTGTPTVGIDSLHNEVSSTATNHAAYLQSTTGLQVKIRFPTLWAIQQYPDYLSILKAELIIKPVQGTYNTVFVLPPQLILSQTDDDNLIGGTVAGANASIDYLSGINTNYTYDITSYIKQQVTAGPENNAKRGLMLTVPAASYNTSFNRAVIGDWFNSNNSRISLKIYYASFPK